MHHIAVAYNKGLPLHPQDALAAPNDPRFYSELTLVGSAAPSEDGKTGKDYVEWEKAQAQGFEQCAANITQNLPSIPSPSSLLPPVHPCSPPSPDAFKSEHQSFPNVHTTATLATTPLSPKLRRHTSFLHNVKSITIRNPFRVAGSQRSPVITEVFHDTAATPALNVGSVSAFVPRVTKPIASVGGFPQRANVVEHRKMTVENVVHGGFKARDGSVTMHRAGMHRTQEGDTDGLFFGSRFRRAGSNDADVGTNKQESRSSRPSTGQSQRKKPPADFLNVTIPNSSIALFDNVV